MDCIDIVIQIVTSFLGTLGFGFLFNVRGKKLLLAALGGMLSWSLFLVLGFAIDSEPIRYFIVSICSTVYAEILARVLKTPASTFCIITLIPLVPGGALYYTATAAFESNSSFMPNLINTAQLAVALSLGIVIVTAVAKYYSKIASKNR